MAEGAIVFIRGGGDLGSASALRLTRCGFRVIIAEQPKPTAVRRTVAFSEAVYDGAARIEEIIGRRIESIAQAKGIWTAGEIPVIVDERLRHLPEIKASILLDAMLSKQNTGTLMNMAPGTIGLGPGFVAGLDVSAVVETNRGPDLGRVIWNGQAEANTAVPAPIHGHTVERVLRAPVSGIIINNKEIGETVETSDIIAKVDDQSIKAPFRGIVRGLSRSGTEVTANMKVGDLDPRLDPSLCLRVSDKALAVAGGVLEATLVLLHRVETPI